MANMNIQKRDLKPNLRNLINFFGKQVSVECIVKLKVTLLTWPSIVSMDVNFLIVDTPNIAYNAFLGRMLPEKGKGNCFNPTSSNEICNAIRDRPSKS